MDEKQLEITALEWFRQIGWEYFFGPDIAKDGENPLRESDRDVLLVPHIKAAFERLNSWIPANQRESIFEDVLAKVRLRMPDLIENNREFTKYLLAGFPVTIQKENGAREAERVYLIDFKTPENNRFVVTNQVSIIGSKGVRRPDIITYINGLPMVVIELKSPAKSGASYDANLEAFNQLQTYKDELHDLFITNSALIISDGLMARVGSLSAGMDRFMPWRVVNDEDDRPRLEWELETLVYGFFDHARLLDYLQNFILFKDDGRHSFKIIAGYHQYHAVQNAIRATIMASNPELASDKRGKIGVVWHTQGSGKSLSMCFYAGKLLKTPEMNNPTILVVTDRNDLDDQLFKTFASAESLFGNAKPVQAESREKLRQLLSEREAGGIIFTTVQKFSPEEVGGRHPVLNERSNIVVISDEAHRTQYGLKSEMNEKGIYTYGYAKHMRDSIPNAAFIGFTGTPIEESDRDTRAVFGDEISVYDIQAAVDDGATVPIYYEPRLARLKLDDAELDKQAEELEDIMADADLEEQEKQKANWTKLERIVGAPNRIEMVAQDIVEHFEKRNRESTLFDQDGIEGKAMIVGMSRAICVALYEAIMALKPDWHDQDPQKGAIKIIMTGAASDPANFQDHLYSKNTRKDLETRFRDPNDPFKMAIVCDMWLTGFDAPSCQTLYIDKPMKGHNLMQAIARVNRVFKSKNGGLVVDYIGIGRELEAALKTYTNAKGKGKPTINVAEAFVQLQKYVQVMRDIFAKTPQQSGCDLGDFEDPENNFKRLVPAVNYIFELRDAENGERNGKKRFLDTLLAINKAYGLCSTLTEAEQFDREIAFYNHLGTLVRKTMSSKAAKRKRDSDALFEQIIRSSIEADGIIDLYEYCGEENPRIDILDDEFFNHIKDSKNKNMALEMLQKLIDNQVKANFKTNIVQESKFTERLKMVMQQYNNRTIDSVEAMEELIKMAKEMTKAAKAGKEMGLEYDELAFYQALVENESAKKEMEDELLKAIAKEITELLKKSVTVDWQKRESIRARLRILVRRTLRKYGYPPDGQDKAVNLILENTEKISDHWTQEDIFK
ncbi:MAG TPA: type I restriction endonuclease subunit R [Candidatus Ignatzschineria merdigallinarum]|uniref:Type I restriction enzyme endonuclease subunit n=1 Tax=Candidatus Ignatzschineria merdigallinarum TaxID=2838621 RepID=A0A9D1Q728_9GAMM|nr:type I restriction endonuclease subunit R [Candidatus Ignatzschineria merdigallinarum]